MKTIQVIVSSEGATRLETQGFAGDACRWASVFLETALGQKLSDLPTAEAFVAPECSSLPQSS